MNRRSFISGAGVSLASVYVLLVQPATDENADLEAQVDDLDTRVTALETQVASLDGGTAGQDEAAEESATASGDSVSLSGNGTTVTDPFVLTAGRYRVNATVTPSGGFFAIILEVYDPSEYVLNEFGEVSGEWSGSAVYEAPADGEYFLSVSNTTGAWTVTFEPF